MKFIMRRWRQTCYFWKNSFLHSMVPKTEMSSLWTYFKSINGWKHLALLSISSSITKRIKQKPNISFSEVWRAGSRDLVSLKRRFVCFFVLFYRWSIRSRAEGLEMWFSGTGSAGRQQSLRRALFWEDKTIAESNGPVPPGGLEVCYLLSVRRVRKLCSSFILVESLTRDTTRESVNTLRALKCDERNDGNHLANPLSRATISCRVSWKPLDGLFSGRFLISLSEKRIIRAVPRPCVCVWHQRSVHYITHRRRRPCLCLPAASPRADIYCSRHSPWYERCS